MIISVLFNQFHALLITYTLHRLQNYKPLKTYEGSKMTPSGFFSELLKKKKRFFNEILPISRLSHKTIGQ